MPLALTNVGAGAQKGSVGPGSCRERIGCSVDGTWGREAGDSDEAEWTQGGPRATGGQPQAQRGLARLTSRSEEGGGRVGELLPRGQGPIGPRKAGQEVVPKVKLVGVALHGTGRGAVSEEPGVVPLLLFHPEAPSEGCLAPRQGLGGPLSLSEPSLTTPQLAREPSANFGIAQAVTRDRREHFWPRFCQALLKVDAQSSGRPALPSPPAPVPSSFPGVSGSCKPRARAWHTTSLVSAAPEG